MVGAQDMGEPMRHGALVAAVAMFTIGTPALADAPLSFDSAGPATQIAQAQTPAYPPPAPQPELPPPAPAPTYVWQPGHWSWNGLQYFWEPGKYVERPAATATYVAGHWEHNGTGWIWVDGRWEYAGVGSSTPPMK
jgi:WXXGXW repeat (2 copies)